MTTPLARPLVRRIDGVLRPDPARVISRPFLPGQEIVGARRRSRSSAVLERVLALSDTEVDDTLDRTLYLYGSRHRDLAAAFDARFQLVAHLVDDAASLSPARRRLVGATFSSEYALEAAALFNPSMVAHPDQSGLPTGAVRFVMTVRAVGEGHVSSVEFRTGIFDGDLVSFDDPGVLVGGPQLVQTTYRRAVFVQQLAELEGDDDEAEVLVAALPERFGREELDSAMSLLRASGAMGATRLQQSIQRLEWVAACNYTVEFEPGSGLGERVLLPSSPSETHGLEDVRLVRHTDDDGSVEYRGTYTAFDGVRVAPQLLRTGDFDTFHFSQLSGTAATDKGMALFPRPVGGRALALSRHDRESNSLAESDDGVRWEVLTTLQVPQHPWELVQLGNCGSPVETRDGWLVLTHGVGPMREYSIGALLLDLEDPRQVIGSLDEPLLTPTADEREGYVPNVLYSCGALLHDDTLVVPYGCSDASIRVALVDVPQLLARLTSLR